MKVTLKYGYVFDVDTLNPYTLQREDARDGKVSVKDKKYLYTLESLIHALRYGGKDYLLEYVEPLELLSAKQDQTIEKVSGYFNDVQLGQVYDKDLVVLYLGNYLATYTPNNRVISLDEKVYDEVGKLVYVEAKEGAEEESKLVLRKVGYCKWLRGLVTEFVVSSLLKKHGDEVVTLDIFIKYYIEELDFLCSGVTVKRQVVELEDDTDDDLVDNLEND